MKALIVDDEVTVRNGLKTIIDWEAYGFSICGEGVDGKDGLEKIIALDPDLVLLDIKMPNMHGTEVAEAARKNGYQGKFIILSGYSDFKYAQSAIRFNVTAYLLKPIDEDELCEALARAGSELTAEAETKANAEINLQMNRDKAICGFLQSDDPPDPAEMERCGIDTACDAYQVAVFDSDNIAKPVREILDEYSSKDWIYAVSIENRPVTVLKGLACIDGFGKRISKYEKELSLSDSFVGIGRVAGSLPEARLSYRDACRMAEAKFFFRGGTAIAAFGADASDVDEPVRAGKWDIDDYKDKIFICIVYHEKKMLFDLLEDMEERFRRMRIKPDKALGLLTHVFNDMQERIKENYPHANARLYGYAEVCDILYGFSRLSGVMKWIGDSSCRLSDSIRMDTLSDAVNKLEHYVSNFSYMNLSLESLARVFGYNSSYLGQAFKKHTGENFNAYLDRIRISNALRLLAETDLKVYEISEKVGYSNLDHFHLRFKEITGKRPGECRRKRCR